MASSIPGMGDSHNSAAHGQVLLRHILADTTCDKASCSKVYGTALHKQPSGRAIFVSHAFYASHAVSTAAALLEHAFSLNVVGRR